MAVSSLFSGCGGLDLGFENAGFKIIYANDIDRDIWETYEKNHKITIDTRSIDEVPSSDIPDAMGIIGGPPCQSWSLAGAMRGIDDMRGQLFYEYIRVLKDKRPLFFLAENVPGIVSKAHISEFRKILGHFENIGYAVNYRLLNANDHGVPQDRRRVIVVGYSEDLGKRFKFPEKIRPRPTLRDAIGDLPDAVPALDKNKANPLLPTSNHEYMNGGFSTIYMSRNRRRGWDQPSFTIQAGGRHAPLHPESAKMHKIGKDKWDFIGENPKYRRLSVRECARIQTFPDDFTFYYSNIASAYKMIGNAVPVKLAEAIARKIIEDLRGAGY